MTEQELIEMPAEEFVEVEKQVIAKATGETSDERLPPDVPLTNEEFDELQQRLKEGETQVEFTPVELANHAVLYSATCLKDAYDVLGETSGATIIASEYITKAMHHVKKALLNLNVGE